MKGFLEALQQLYKKVLVGAALEHDPQAYVLYLQPARSDPDAWAATSPACADAPGVQGQRPPSPGPPAAPAAPARWKSSARELRLLQLTVVKVMVTRILSAETDPRAKEKYREVVAILLASSDLDSKLICMFQESDKLLSHVAAGCLALLLYFQLKEEITLSNSWIAFCEKNLSEYSESDKVVCCLWTLTAVMKEILKGTCPQKAEILKQFLSPLDTNFAVFYNSLFSQRWQSLQGTSKIVNCLLCFLDLLEVLTASRIHLDLHLPCQRLFFLKPSPALDILAWPVQAFVKRRLVILLKRCLLGKAGEDQCRGPVAALRPPRRLLDVDMSALAGAVLQAVDLGLLRTLAIHGKPSCFGGGEVQPGRERLSGPDHVILRAASLLLIKSLEIKFQRCASAEEMEADLQRYMTALLTFLKPPLQRSWQSHHPCEWFSGVFIEQDDDMLEAAGISMRIYLQLTREYQAAGRLAQEKDTWDHLTHENGCNPHCIFLFFLKNIGFDSTVLLDFLISSETCFLEYFVRYLKLLHRDWETFLTICKYFDATECNDSVNICGCKSSLVRDTSGNYTESRLSAALGRHRNAHACVSWPSRASSEPANQVAMSRESRARPPARSRPSPQAPQSLVDYDTSDDSEAESTDPCSADSKQASLHPATAGIQDTEGTSAGKKELCLELQSRPVAPRESKSPRSVDCDKASDNIVCEVGISYRAVQCFEELQGAVSRLHRRDLFPYNPTALLKLLRQVQGTQ